MSMATDSMPVRCGVTKSASVMPNVSLIRSTMPRLGCLNPCGSPHLNKLRKEPGGGACSIQCGGMLADLLTRPPEWILVEFAWLQGWGCHCLAGCKPFDINS